MAAPMLNQLNTLVANLFTAGLLDDQFQQLQMLQDWGAPDLVVEVVTLFCEYGEHIIGEIAKLLYKPCVDYDKVDDFVHQLMGSSASLGAQRVKNSCIQLHDCCKEKSIDGCLKLLNSVRNDFYDLCSMFKPHALAGPADPSVDPKL